jgi:hypothetical protein
MEEDCWRPSCQGRDSEMRENIKTKNRKYDYVRVRKVKRGLKFFIFF